MPRSLARHRPRGRGRRPRPGHRTPARRAAHRRDPARRSPPVPCRPTGGDGVKVTFNGLPARDVAHVAETPARQVLLRHRRLLRLRRGDQRPAGGPRVPPPAARGRRHPDRRHEDRRRGRGPAGMAAARTAAGRGRRGHHGRRGTRGGRPVPARQGQVRAPRRHAPQEHRGVARRKATPCTSRARDNSDFDALIIATGAYDRPLPFPGWDGPGVITAGAAQALAKQGVTLAERVIVAGTGPFLLPVATALQELGATLVGVYEANSPLAWAREARAVLANRHKIAELARYRKVLPHLETRTAVIAKHGDRVTVAKLDRQLAAGQPPHRAGRPGVHRPRLPPSHRSRAARQAHQRLPRRRRTAADVGSRRLRGRRGHRHRRRGPRGGRRHRRRSRRGTTRTATEAVGSGRARAASSPRHWPAPTP